MPDLHTALREAIETFRQTLENGAYQGSPWFKDLLRKHQQRLMQVEELANAQAAQLRELQDSLATAAMASEQQLAALANAIAEKERFRDLWQEKVRHPCRCIRRPQSY